MPDQISDISEPPSELAALMNEMKFLEFRFDTHEGNFCNISLPRPFSYPCVLTSAAPDFERFVRTFHEARAADEARPAFSLADLSAELENTSKANELSAQRERAELEALLLTSPMIRARAESGSVSPMTTPHFPIEMDAVAVHGRR